MSPSMPYADIRTQLRDAIGVPEEALRAARGHVALLAGEVYPLLDLLARGTWLTPTQRSFAYYGLHVLAVERHADLYAHLLKMLRLPEDELAILFVERPEVTLPQMLLGVFDGNDKPLFHMLEHADLSVPARWSLLDLVARLTFDKRIPRDDTVAFLTRFEAAPLADPDDLAWWAWEDAVCRLGIVELKPALERVWALEVNADQSDVAQAERALCLASLELAALDPADATAFDEADLRPMTDVVDALAWLHRRQAVLTEHADATPTAADAAPDVGLSLEEFEWLDGFFESRRASEFALSLEGLDGLLTAVTIGPAAPSIEDCLPAIFGEEFGGAQPEWPDAEQRRYFLATVSKRRDAIAMRAVEAAAHVPLIGPYPDDERGLDWADGFSAGVAMHDGAWEPIFASTRGGEAVYRIFDLAPSTSPDETPLTGGARRQRLDELPALIKLIAAFWRDPKAAIPALDQPARSTKIGRNDPCPCGSGKKYKKCHGGAAGSGGLLH